MAHSHSLVISCARNIFSQLENRHRLFGRVPSNPRSWVEHRRWEKERGVWLRRRKEKSGGASTIPVESPFGDLPPSLFLPTLSPRFFFRFLAQSGEVEITYALSMSSPPPSSPFSIFVLWCGFFRHLSPLPPFPFSSKQRALRFLYYFSTKLLIAPYWRP